MKRTVLTVITLCVVTAARASDLASTFHFDPALRREANPIVAQLGADAQTMVLANIIGVLVLLLVPLLFYWRGRSKKLTTTPKGIWDLAGLYLYDRPMSRRQLLLAFLLCWPLPKDWFQVLRLWGLAASWAVVAGSFAAAFSWWAISEWQWSAYRTLYATLSLWRYPLILPLLAIPGGIFGAVMFFRLEYAEREHTGRLTNR